MYLAKIAWNIDIELWANPAEHGSPYVVDEIDAYDPDVYEHLARDGRLLLRHVPADKIAAKFTLHVAFYLSDDVMTIDIPVGIEDSYQVFDLTTWSPKSLLKETPQ